MHADSEQSDRQWMGKVTSTNTIQIICCVCAWACVRGRKIQLTHIPNETANRITCGMHPATYRYLNKVKILFALELKCKRKRRRREKTTFNQRCTTCIHPWLFHCAKTTQSVNTFAKEIHFVICTCMFVYKIATSNRGSVDFYIKMNGEKIGNFTACFYRCILYFNKRSVTSTQSKNKKRKQKILLQQKIDTNHHWMMTYTRKHTHPPP